jgi:hypothetical protein
VIVTMHASKLKTKQERNIYEQGLKVYKERQGYKSSLISETTSVARVKTRLSSPDRALPALLLLNWNIYKWRTTSIVWCVLNATMRIFI